MTLPSGRNRPRVAEVSEPVRLPAVFNFEHHPAALRPAQPDGGGWVPFSFFAMPRLQAVPPVAPEPIAPKLIAPEPVEPEPVAPQPAEPPVVALLPVGDPVVELERDGLPPEILHAPHRSVEPPLLDEAWPLPGAPMPVAWAVAPSPIARAAVEDAGARTPSEPPIFEPAPPLPPAVAVMLPVHKAAVLPGLTADREPQVEPEPHWLPVSIPLPVVQFGHEVPTEAAPLAAPASITQTVRPAALPDVRPWPGLSQVEDASQDDDEPREAGFGRGLRRRSPMAAPPLDLAPASRRGLPVAMVVLALGLVAGLAVLAAVFVPGWLHTANSIPGVLNAPMMVVRAAVSGRVTGVGVVAGQPVSPQSPLLSFQTNDPGRPERSVLAGVHGVVRSVETVAGAEIIRGVPLVRLQDCDRAFLTVPADSELAAGDQVEVGLPNMAVLIATMRVSSGIMEPPNTLVAAVAPGALTVACPVGATAALSRTAPRAASPALPRTASVG